MNELKAFNDLLYKRPDFEGMKEFYKKLNEKVKAANKHACWEDYMTLCKLGGSRFVWVFGYASQSGPCRTF
jgi:hypothetical protein